MKNYFNWFVLISIFLLAGWLRFYKLETYFNFSGELGDNLLDIKNMWWGDRSWLLGPPTSHPWLYFGPFYYWLALPIELIFNFNPLGVGYLGASLGVALVILNFGVVKQIFNLRLALISSLLMSASPLWVNFSRDARFYFWVTLPFYVLLYLMHQKKQNNLLIGLIIGLMLNFHYSAILFIPVVFFLTRNIKRLILGILVSLLPLLIVDAATGFLMFKNLLLWFPYRIAGFVGLYPKNNLNFSSLTQSLISVYKLIGLTLTEQTILWPILLLIILISFFILKNKFLLSCWLITLLAVIVHGSSPLHYLLPVFPIPILLYSLFLDKLMTKPVGIVIGSILLTTFIIGNGPLRLKLPTITYAQQFLIAQEIVKAATGRAYSLARIGENDQFEENYSQNYRYLLWYLGNEPKENEALKFTIIEE